MGDTTTDRNNDNDSDMDFVTDFKKYTRANYVRATVETHENSPDCTVFEFKNLPEPFDAFAEAHLSGDYPSEGKFACNSECDEIIYVVVGEGTMKFADGSKASLKKHDLILIPKTTRFRYIVPKKLTILVQTHPKFTKEQHVVS